MHVIVLAALLGSPALARDIEVSDGRAETLRAALEDPANAGATVHVSGHYLLDKGIKIVPPSIKLVGRPDATGVPPSIKVDRPDGIREGDCRAVFCLTSGHTVKQIVLGVEMEAFELPGRSGTFAGLHISDALDGEVLVRDVVISRAIGVGAVVASARDHAAFRVRIKDSEIQTVVDNLTGVSTVGINVVSTSDWSLVDIDVSATDVAGAEVGVSVLADGASFAVLDVKLTATLLDVGAIGVQAEAWDTELLSMNLAGNDVGISGYTVTAVALAPFIGGGVDDTFDVLFKDASFDGATGREEDVVVSGPTDGGTYHGNDVRVRLRELDTQQVNLSVPNVDGNRTSVTVGRISPRTP